MFFCEVTDRYVIFSLTWWINFAFGSVRLNFKRLDLQDRFTKKTCLSFRNDESTMPLWACPFVRVQGSDQLHCMLLPQYIVQASQHRPLCPHKHIQKGVIISQDVEIEDLPVHASLWVFWHDGLFRFAVLLFLLLEEMLNPTTLWAMCLCHLELSDGAERNSTVGFCVCVSL